MIHRRGFLSALAAVAVFPLTAVRSLVRKRRVYRIGVDKAVPLSEGSSSQVWYISRISDPNDWSYGGA